MTALMHGVGQLLCDRDDLPMPDIQLHMNNVAPATLIALAKEHSAVVHKHGCRVAYARIEVMPDDGAGSVTIILYAADSKFTSA